MWPGRLGPRERPGRFERANGPPASGGPTIARHPLKIAMPACTDRSPLLCEIRASSGALATDLERTIAFCAEKTGFAIAIVVRAHDARTSTVTLQIPARFATADDSVWCFVCRLACLCPQARIGALVPAVGAFASHPAELAG